MHHDSDKPHHLHQDIQTTRQWWLTTNGKVFTSEMIEFSDFRKKEAKMSFSGDGSIGVLMNVKGTYTKEEMLFAEVCTGMMSA